MSKRPGVAASIRLSGMRHNVQLWERVEAQGDEVVLTLDTARKGGRKTKLQACELFVAQERMDCLRLALRERIQRSISQSDLLDTLIPWKFAVGKPRPALWKALESNSELEIEKCTATAFQLAKSLRGTLEEEDEDAQMKQVLDSITQLNGVGPATASALASLLRPDVFGYMYDEVIDTFEPKRTYTLPVYMRCNKECQSIARALQEKKKENESNKSNDKEEEQEEDADWTPARVARTLWIAARASALGLIDLTLEADKDTTMFLKPSSTKSPQETKYTKTSRKTSKTHDEDTALVRRSKRRKQSS